MKLKVLLSLFFVAGAAVAQTNSGPANIAAINSTLYVGAATGWYPTIQSTVTAACAVGHKRIVRIPAGYLGSDLISGVTGGCTNTNLFDDRTTPLTCYAWSGSAYAVSSCGSASVTAAAVNAVGNITNNTSGNAGTASALAATPTNCGAGVASTGVAANGNALGCFTPSGSGVPASQIQQQTQTYAADTGTANAYAITLSPAPTLVAGSRAVFKAANANTGASTLAVNGGSAIAIKKNSTVALASGDIAAGQVVEVQYDGTFWQATLGGGGGGPNNFPGTSNQYISAYDSATHNFSSSQPNIANLAGTATPGQLPVMVGSGAGHAAGIVPDPGATAGTSKYLREDGSFVVPPGSTSASILSLFGNGMGQFMAYPTNTTGPLALRNLNATDVSNAQGYVSASQVALPTANQLGLYRFTELGTGNVLDRSGNGNDCTPSSNSGIVRTGLGFSYTDNVGQIDCPAALNAANTFYFVVQLGINHCPGSGGTVCSNPFILWPSGSLGTHAVALATPPPQGSGQSFSFGITVQDRGTGGGGSYLASSSDFFAGTHVIAYTCPVSGHPLTYLDGHPSTAYGITGISCNGAMTAGHYSFGPNADDMYIFGANFYSTVHDDATVASISETMRLQAIGQGAPFKPQPYQSNVKFSFGLGDSITCFSYDSPTPTCGPFGAVGTHAWPMTVNSYTTVATGYVPYGNGTPSANVEQQISYAPYVYAPLCTTGGGQTQGTIFEGTNNFLVAYNTLSGSFTAAQWATHVAELNWSFINQMQGYGCNMGVVAMIDRLASIPSVLSNDGAGNNWEQDMVLLNANLRKNWKANKANLFVDLGSDPAFGAFGAANSTTYYTNGSGGTDYVHPGLPGENRISQAYACLLDDVNSPKLGSIPALTTSPTLGCGMEFENFDVTAGSLTPTLGSAMWQTGRDRRYCNATPATTANTLTINAPGSEPFIGGATSVTVARGTCTTLTATFNGSTSTPGNNWQIIDTGTTGTGVTGNTQTAGAGGVTSNTFVRLDTSAPSKFITALAGSVGSGVALTSAAANATFTLSDPVGTVQVTTDAGGAVAGHLIVGSTVTPGLAMDSGQTSSLNICEETGIFGSALTTTSGGALVTVNPESRGSKGHKVCQINSLAPPAAPYPTAPYWNATGQPQQIIPIDAAWFAGDSYFHNASTNVPYTSSIVPLMAFDIPAPTWNLGVDGTTSLAIVDSLLAGYVPSTTGVRSMISLDGGANDSPSDSCGVTTGTGCLDNYVGTMNAGINYALIPFSNRVMASAGTGSGWSVTTQQAFASGVTGTYGTPMSATASGVTRTFTFTTPTNVSKVRLVYSKNNTYVGSTFTVSADGGSPINDTTCNGATTSFTSTGCQGVALLTTGSHAFGVEIPVSSATSHHVDVTTASTGTYLLDYVEWIQPGASFNLVPVLNIYSGFTNSALYNTALSGVVSAAISNGEATACYLDQTSTTNPGPGTTLAADTSGSGLVNHLSIIGYAHLYQMYDNCQTATGLRYSAHGIGGNGWQRNGQMVRAPLSSRISSALVITGSSQLAIPLVDWAVVGGTGTITSFLWPNNFSATFGGCQNWQATAAWVALGSKIVNGGTAAPGTVYKLCWDGANTVFAPALLSAITSATANTGAGVTSATCATATCSVQQGSYTIVGGTGTTGTFLTLVWPATSSAWRCTVVQSGGSTTYLGLSHSNPSTTGMTIASAAPVSGITFTLDYNCQP